MAVTKYIPIFISRIDAAPLDDDDFSFSFNSWISNMIDTLNYSIEEIQDNFNGDSPAVVFPSLTQAEILAIAAAMPPPPNGAAWYCSDHGGSPCLVAYINGALVQLSTSSFP